MGGTAKLSHETLKSQGLRTSDLLAIFMTIASNPVTIEATQASRISMVLVYKKSRERTTHGSTDK